MEMRLDNGCVRNLDVLILFGPCLFGGETLSPPNHPCSMLHNPRLLFIKAIDDMLLRESILSCKHEFGTDWLI